MKRFKSGAYQSVRDEQRHFMSEMIKTTPTWFKFLWVGSAFVGLTLIGLLTWLLIRLIVHFS